jgi:hypothetical protein
MQQNDASTPPAAIPPTTAGASALLSTAMAAEPLPAGAPPVPSVISPTSDGGVVAEGEGAGATLRLAPQRGEAEAVAESDGVGVGVRDTDGTVMAAMLLNSRDTHKALQQGSSASILQLELPPFPSGVKYSHSALPALQLGPSSVSAVTTYTWETEKTGEVSRDPSSPTLFRSLPKEDTSYTVRLSGGDRAGGA